jgi:ribosome-associated protein
MADDELILRNGSVIPRSLLAFSAVTSSGPGGQHVNRSNTAVELRVAVDELPLNPGERSLVRERLQNRITRSGELRVEASAERSQLRNRRTAEQRLVGLLDAALAVDPERTATRRSRRVQERERQSRERAQARRASRRWTPDE